jgi:hypothetical protein
MSERHDEHGPVRDVDPEYGPEWWAIGGEVCTCEHGYDEHVATAAGTRPCLIADCACQDFRGLDSTMAAGDEPSSRQPQV